MLFSSCIDNKKSSSTGRSGTASSAGSRNMERVDEFMRHGPAFPIGSTLVEIKKNFGTPLKQTVVKKQNIHDPSLVDAIYKWYYDGLYLEMYHVTGMNKDILLVLEVTGDQFPITYGLSVGSSKEKVRKALGGPNEEKPALWRYFASDFIMGSFEFAFQNDTVVSIRWHYTID